MDRLMRIFMLYFFKGTDRFACSSRSESNGVKAVTQRIKVVKAVAVIYNPST
jgi:hypothetical protein